MRRLPSLALIALMLFGLAALPARAQTEVEPATLTVNGRGEASAPPDLATVMAAVVTDAASAAQALAANSTQMREVIGALQAAGLEPRNIRTSNVSVQPRYEQPAPNRPSELVGYQVNNNVTATVRTIDRLGGLIDALITAGANRIDGIGFEIAEPGPLLDMARARAVADARHKAEVLADAAGVSLGRIISIEESGGGGPRPMMRARMEASLAADVPIALGENTVEANVVIVWAIDASQ